MRSRSRSEDGYSQSNFVKQISVVHGLQAGPRAGGENSKCQSLETGKPRVQSPSGYMAYWVWEGRGR